jgi:L-iditol 2-dehydrogenase
MGGRSSDVPEPPVRMPVARLHGPGDVRVGEEPVRAPSPGELLVRVTAVGLCGSDLHWFEDARIGETGLAEPLVLGHEIGGVVASGPRAGERVALDPADPCRSCAVCATGRVNLCPRVRFAGLAPTDGGLRGFMAWPELLCAPVPDTIPDAEVPLLEALGVALHALDLGRVAPGMRAAVIGCGPIGLLLVAALRDAGIRDVVGTDRLPHRIQAARNMGATEVLRVGDGGVVADGSDGAIGEVDVAFEVAGEDDAVDAAIRSVRPGGRVVLVGIPGSDRTTFTASIARRKGLELVMSRRMQPADLPRAIGLVATGRVHLAPLVTDRLPLANVGAAFHRLAGRRGLKVVVIP